METLLRLEPEELYKNASEELLTNLYDSKSSHIDLNIMNNAKDEFKEILFLHSFNMDKVKKHIQCKECNAERIQWFTSVLEKKSNELLYQILLHNSSQYGETVINFDWSLKTIFGTSDLKTHRGMLLQLALSIINSNNGQKGKLFEMDKDVLKKLIDVLQNADL